MRLCAQLDDMRRRGLAPTWGHWTALVRAHCRADDLENALRVVDAMTAAGVQPQPRTWAVIRHKAAFLGRPDIVALVRPVACY